jgi:hypothetical protein
MRVLENLRPGCDVAGFLTGDPVKQPWEIPYRHQVEGPLSETEAAFQMTTGNHEGLIVSELHGLFRNHSTGYDFLLREASERISTDSQLSTLKQLERIVLLNCALSDTDIGIFAARDLFRITHKPNTDTSYSLTAWSVSEFHKEVEAYLRSHLLDIITPDIKKMYEKEYGSDIEAIRLNKSGPQTLELIQLAIKTDTLTLLMSNYFDLGCSAGELHIEEILANAGWLTPIPLSAPEESREKIAEYNERQIVNMIPSWIQMARSSAKIQYRKHADDLGLGTDEIDIITKEQLLVAAIEAEKEATDAHPSIEMPVVRLPLDTKAKVKATTEKLPDIDRLLNNREKILGNAAV